MCVCVCVCVVYTCVCVHVCAHATVEMRTVCVLYWNNKCTSGSLKYLQSAPYTKYNKFKENNYEVDDSL